MMRGRFEDLYGGEEIGDEFVVMGIVELVAGEIGTALDHQTLGVDKPAVFAGFFQRQSLFHHGRDRQVAGADARFAGPKEENPLVFQSFRR